MRISIGRDKQQQEGKIEMGIIERGSPPQREGASRLNRAAIHVISKNGKSERTPLPSKWTREVNDPFPQKLVQERQGGDPTFGGERSRGPTEIRKKNQVLHGWCRCNSYPGHMVGPKGTPPGRSTKGQVLTPVEIAVCPLRKKGGWKREERVNYAEQ